MTRLIALITAFAALFATLVAPSGAEAFVLWNDFRASALDPADNVLTRVEQAQVPGEVHTILWAEGGVAEGPLALGPDGPSTLEAWVPGPVASRAHYGFRRVDGPVMDLLSVRLDAGVAPAVDDLTLLADDPVGDEAFGITNLDLTGCRIATDGTTLYASLSNAGGGFPVNSGLTFYSYLLGIKNPYVAEPDTVFGLIHTVTAGGIIEPGLYQINGDGVNDLVKLGEITATEVPGADTLILSCQLADLVANPVFASWYDSADPQLDVAGFTQRITLLGGVGEADNTAGAFWFLRSVFLDPGPNTSPALSSLTVPFPGEGGFANVFYTDAEAHSPVLAEIVFDGTAVYPLRPQMLDYSGSVEYRSNTDIPPLTTGSWTSAKVRFSDDSVTVVEAEQFVSSVMPSGGDLSLKVYPNPTSVRLAIAFELPRSTDALAEVYDLAGRRIAVLSRGTLPAGPNMLTWDGRGGDGRRQPDGIYFVRVKAGADVVTRRIALVK